MTTEQGRVYAEITSPIGWVTIDNPARHNAMTLEMWSALAEVVVALESDPAVRVVVVRGAGAKAFVSGADISQFDRVRNTSEANKEYDRVARVAMQRLASSEKPTIAALRGWCLGGGVALALSCDLRLGDEALRFGIPAGRLGIGYEWKGVSKLVQVVGAVNARRIFLTADRFDAAEALRMGFVQQVLPADTFDEAVRATADRIARNAPLTLRAVRIALQEFERLDAAPDVARMDAAVRAAIDSDDFIEGRRAFLDKREPRFTGR